MGLTLQTNPDKRCHLLESVRGIGERAGGGLPGWHLALRRVERQQVLIEHLHTHPDDHLTLADLAHELRVSLRTIARDVERLRDSGVPLLVRPGRGGGVRLARIDRVLPVQFDVAEVAALLSSLAVLGPTTTISANPAAHK